MIFSFKTDLTSITIYIAKVLSKGRSPSELTLDLSIYYHNHLNYYFLL